MLKSGEQHLFLKINTKQNQLFAALGRDCGEEIIWEKLIIVPDEEVDVFINCVVLADAVPGPWRKGVEKFSQRNSHHRNMLLSWKIQVIIIVIQLRLQTDGFVVRDALLCFLDKCILGKYFEKVGPVCYHSYSIARHTRQSIL